MGGSSQADAMPDSVDAGLSWPVLSCAFAAALSSLNFGWSLGEPNVPEDAIKDCVAGPKANIHGFPTCLPMSTVLWGLVVGMVALGALAGSLAAGRVADRFGRKTVLLANNTFFIAGALLLSTSTTVVQLAIGRFVSGIGCGVASAVVATYNSECAPARVRGLAGAVLQLSVEAGVFLSQLAAIVLADVPNWRILFSLAAALSIAQLLWLPFMPESPKFLVSRGRLDEAERALRFLRPGYDVAKELVAMVDASQRSSTGHPVSDEARFVADAGDESKIAEDDGDSTAVTQHATSSRTVGITDILRGRTPDVLWHPLFCTLFLMGFQQWTGTKGVVFYSTEIMVGVLNLTRSQVQHTPNSAQWVTIGLAGMGVVGVVASMLLIDRLGRRRLLLVSTGGLVTACALVVVGCTCNAPPLAVAAMFIFKATYCLGMAPIPWLCASEMLPYYALGAVSGFACALNWLMIFAVGLLFPVLAKVLGGFLFLPFACMNAMAFVVVLLFVPETKGRQVCDIIQRHGRRVHIVLGAHRARRSASV